MPAFWSEVLHEYRLLGFWTQLGLGVLLLPSIGLLHYLLSRFFRYFLSQLLRKRKAYVKRLARMYSIRLLLFGLSGLLVSFLPADANLKPYAQVGVRVFGAMLLFLTVYQSLDIPMSLLRTLLRKRKDERTEKHLLPPLRTLLKVSILLLGGLYILMSAGVEVWHLVASLSIGGLAVALASQDMLKNLFGALAIFLDKPFKTGDWIVCGEIDGVVEEINLRSTRIRTFEDTLVCVPNSVLAHEKVDNYGSRNKRRYKTHLCLNYNTPAEAVKIFVQGLRQLVMKQQHTDKEDCEIHLHDHHPTHQSILVYVFFRTPTWSEELQARHEFNLHMLSWAAHLGISLGVDFVTRERTKLEAGGRAGQTFGLPRPPARLVESKSMKKLTPVDWRKRYDTFFASA